MAVVQVIMQYSRTVTGKIMQNVHYFEGANLDAGDFSKHAVQLSLVRMHRTISPLAQPF